MRARRPAGPPSRTARIRAAATADPRLTVAAGRAAVLNQRELLLLARERSQSPLVSMRQFGTTTPGKFLIIGLLLFVSCVSFGWYAAYSLDHRTNLLQNTIDSSEPIAESSQVLYSSLSIADAAANSSFISGGLAPQDLRDRYTTAIATAAQALVHSASGTIENPQTQSDLNVLAAQLPVYTGLVETARTNNRLANPVGSAYLGEASNLMQSVILPAAERLYEQRSAAISDTKNNFTRPLWGVYISVTLLLLALLATHGYVARRSRRIINLGLLVAIAAIVVSLLWVLIGGVLSVSSTSEAENSGARPLHDLTTIRNLTQQARSDETLALARLGDEGSLDSSYTQATSQISDLLKAYHNNRSQTEGQDAVNSAIAALGRWQSAHGQMIERSNVGDFVGAISWAVGDRPNGSAAAYSDVDDALTQGIAETRSAFRDDVNTARVVLGFAGTGVLVLGIVAGLATVVGFYPRVREYR